MEDNKKIKKKKISLRIPVFVFSNIYIELFYNLLLNLVISFILFDMITEIYHEGFEYIIIFTVFYTILDFAIKLQIIKIFPKIIAYTFGLIFIVTHLISAMFVDESISKVSFSSEGTIVLYILILMIIKFLINSQVKNIIRNRKINNIIRRLPNGKS